MRKFYIFFLVSATAFLFTTGLKFTRIKTFFSKVKTSIKTANWLKVFSKIDHNLGNLNVLRKRLKFDIAAGYSSISSPEEAEPDINYLLADIMDEKLGPKSPVLWAHQVGKRVVRKVPDTALLGVLVLIASELLRRGVNSNSETLPPLIREFANATIIELDLKLEMLSSLEWKIDPFLKAELENLQTQPLEVIDKFIVNSILPSVDKDFAPFLLKYMVGDTKKVKTITQSLKDLIQLSMVLLEGTGTGSFQGPTSLDRTTSTIIEQVDLVGQSIEEVVNDWNRIVVQFTGSITEYLNTDSVLNLLAKQFHLKDTPIVPSSALGDTQGSGSDGIMTSKGPQKSLLWNSKRPITIDTSIDMIKTDFKNVDKDRNTLNLMGPVRGTTKAASGTSGVTVGGASGSDKDGTRHPVHDTSKPTAVSGFVAFDDISRISLLKPSKNTKIPDKSSISTTLLNNITKKPARTNAGESNPTKSKSPSPSTLTTPSAFTSYLQDLMD